MLPESEFTPQPSTSTQWLVRKGPSGYGKTDLCLREMVSELERDPFGDPLLFVTPKQSTFEMERAILGRLSRPAFSRLHILSFERLALWILTRLEKTTPEYLSDEGRLMKLRALLRRHTGDLSVFRSGARLPGFAKQLNEALTEFQTLQFGPDDIRQLGDRIHDNQRLRSKLHDAATIFGRYQEWLEVRGWHDASDSFKPTLEILNKEPLGQLQGKLKIQRIWLDGFIEYTPIQIEMIAALARVGVSGIVTLPWDENQALENEPRFRNLWFGARRSITRLAERLNGIEGVTLEEHILVRKPHRYRFKQAPPLEHLEKHWADPRRYTAAQEAAFPVHQCIEGVECLSPEQEVREAARRIRRMAREEGLRFKQIAVLTRSPESYEPYISRLFAQYEIPYFLDHREPVGGHPLAELTRDALNLAARDWRFEDWFGVLKTGLAKADFESVDLLENAALEFGWDGRVWLSPLQKPDPCPEGFEDWERWRSEWVKPLHEFEGSLPKKPSGLEIAESIRGLWDRLEVESQLKAWSENSNPPEAVHLTVWKQMNDWLDNVEMAFENEAFSLKEWVGILETGLENLTVGVIPPASDQVIIGDLERAKVFNIHTLILLGLNEGVFPKRPSVKGLLTETDRRRLLDENLPYLASRERRWSEEEALAYQTWTRPASRLILLNSQRNPEGVELTVSPFQRRIQRLFPTLEWKRAELNLHWSELESPNEIFEWIAEKMKSLQRQTLASGEEPVDWRDQLKQAEPLPREVWGWIEKAPQYQKWDHEWSQLRRTDHIPALDSDLADRLYGTPLKLAVSHLEQYAKCPFQFFSQFGLKAQERKKYDLDRRAQGSFQHDVLATFHEELQQAGKKWRDITPEEAAERVESIGNRLAPTLYHGVLEKDSRSRFVTQNLIRDLTQFVQVWVRAMSFYQMDPAYVELKFGMDKSPLPAWLLELDGGKALQFRGIVDRIDLVSNPHGEGTLILALDYKSGIVKPDPALMKQGIQMQLPSYLAMLWKLDDPKKVAPGPLIPVGMFFSRLGAKTESVTDRPDEVEAEAPMDAYKLSGRFRFSQLEVLDNRNQKSGDFIPYRLTNKGAPYANSKEPMRDQDFQSLMENTEAIMIRLGNQIYSGEIRLNPFRQGTSSACDYCLYDSFCRKDPENLEWNDVG